MTDPTNYVARNFDGWIISWLADLLNTRHGFRQHLWQKQHPIIVNIATGTKVPMSATLHGYIGHISGALSLTLIIFFLKKKG